MLTIKILGTGCPNCKRLEQAARQAVAVLAVPAEIVKVTDYGAITAYPILATPGLVIAEKVVSSGRVPTVAEIATWIADVAGAT
jgi:small redox-active disulfide protein 2